MAKPDSPIEKAFTAFADHRRAETRKKSLGMPFVEEPKPKPKTLSARQRTLKQAAKGKGRNV